MSVLFWRQDLERKNRLVQPLLGRSWFRYIDDDGDNDDGDEYHENGDGADDLLKFLILMGKVILLCSIKKTLQTLIK